MEFVEEQGVSIVANGTFNPAIFHPAWLNKNGIITDEEERSAVLDITHKEIAQFQIPGLRFDIQTERASIHAVSEPLVRCADLFSQIFREFLPHTPIKSAGINYWAHIQLRDWAQRQRFGRRLAPIEPWGEFGQLMEQKDPKDAGGLSTLSLRAAFKEYGENGALNVSIQPSAKVENDQGVFISVNHHFSEFLPDTAPASRIVELFDDCMARSRKIILHLIDEGRSS